ncbi:MAG: branched-chain amino acid transport system substrate-binding protein, partial [Actinomycetota bacterium]|nr:branched-chain amino acid transport system substrate-binding protein [Actinomycetota bacterium]
MKRVAPLLVALLLLIACDGGSSPDSAGTLTIVVNAPFSKAPYIGDTIFRGVDLAIDQVNAAGGVVLGDRSYTLRAEKMDNALSPQKALDNVRAAVASGAVAVVDEGTGIEGSWSVANDADIPIGIVYQGGEQLVDPQAKPNVFRITPTDHGIAYRFAEYLGLKKLKVAFIHDDSDYGEQGKVAFDDAFGRVPEMIAADISVPATAPDVSAQVLEARQSKATGLLVWARSSVVAEIVRATRSSGWDVPIYTAPTGEDPLVRQQLSDHPEWVDGLTFASGRMTAEKGPAPWMAFQTAYEQAYGQDEVGVK